MNWKSFIAGSVAGFVGGYYLRKTWNEKIPLPAEQVLGEIKKAFKKEGPIDGSWMQMKTETYIKQPFETKVYRGGIMRTHNGEQQQFEFIADAFTGNVYEINTL